MTEERSAVRIRRIPEMLAAIPPMFGFVPTDSLVIAGIESERGKIEVLFRYDLPKHAEMQQAAPAIAQHVRHVLAGHGITRALVVGYGVGNRVTPIVDQIRELPLVLIDALRVEGNRYWSYICQDPGCCPPSGTPFAQEDVGTELSARLGVPEVDRDALAASLVGSPISSALIEAVERGILTDIREGKTSERLKLVTKTLERLRGGEAVLEQDAADIIVPMRYLPMRDHVWAMMVPEHGTEHLALFRTLMRMAPYDYVPAVASVLGFVAWQVGHGALANVAVERALVIDPSYSMAILIRDVVTNGLPPRLAVPPMTPAEVADAYAHQKGANDG